MKNKLKFITTILYSPATREYHSPQQSTPTTEYQSYPTQSSPPSPTSQYTHAAQEPRKVSRPSLRNPRGVGMLPIFLLIFIIILLAAAWFLPWWQHSYEVDDTDYKTVSEYDLKGLHQYQELTDEQTETVCPSCGYELDEDDLEDKDYYCPECGDWVSERDVCPLCGDTIYGSYCSNCGQTVTPESGYYCYDCGELVDEIYGYDCYYCDEVFESPEEITTGEEGERGYFEQGYGSTPYYYFNVEHDNLYGVRGYANSANVWSVTNFLWFMSILLLLITLIAIIGYKYSFRMKGSNKARKGILIAGVFALLFVIITPLFFAVAYGAAIDQDWEDRYEDMPDDAEPDDQIPKGFMGQDSTDYEYYYGDGDAPEADHEWGPSSGWFLALIAMIFGFIALGIVIKTYKRRGPKPPRVPPTPRAQPPPPPTAQSDYPNPPPPPPPEPTYPDYSDYSARQRPPQNTYY